MIKQATFRFYEELNDFLPLSKKKVAFVHTFYGNPSIKDVIEATTTRKSTTTIEDIHTLTGYTFVIGSDKPVIKI